MTTVLNLEMKLKAKYALRRAINDCMSTYTVNYADMIAALASVTSELCVEQAQARSHAESCSARDGRYLCTCGMGQCIVDSGEKIIPPRPEPTPDMFVLYPPATDSGAWTLPASIAKRLRIMFGKGA